MPAVFDHPYLDLARMEMLRRCRLLPRGTAEGTFAGPHRSRFRGTAVEFADYREYVPGDDVRMIDWKVVARTDKHYIKLFEAERNLLSYLLVDSSGSMAYAGLDRRGPSKLECAGRLAAALAYLVIDQGDQAGLSLAGSGVHTHLRPTSGWIHLASLVKTLGQATAEGDTDLGTALGQLFGRASARGVVIIFSDFLGVDTAFWRGLDLFRRSHNDVLLFHIIHPEEECLPEVPLARFVDCEGAKGAFIAEIAVVREAYSRRFRDHCEAVQAGAATRGCEYFPFHCNEDPYLFLKRVLMGRNL